MRRASFVATVSGATILILALWALGSDGPQFAYATHTDGAENNLPHATVKVWNTQPSLGFNPDESVEDPTGLTGHGTGAPTIVTNYENTTHPSGPCGISYWNPVTNVFKDYGKTGGFQTGVDINRGGPVQLGGPFGSSFGPGDTWMSGQMTEPLYMHIAGTDNFRTYFVEETWGVEVDEATGNVFFTQPASGFIARLNPATNVVTRWSVGGNPAYVTLDSAGRPYATLSSSHQIARVNPGADGVLGTGDDTVTKWTVPGPASFVTVPGVFQTPNGITIDVNGRIWFVESNSHEIGRLSGGADGVIGTADDVICEYSKSGLSNPQLIASTGSAGLLQAYFTEGNEPAAGVGNSVSVLTQVEADNAANPGRVCMAVPPVTAAVTVTTFSPSIFDEVVTPRTFTIMPTIFDVPGLDGFASGTTKTAGPDGIPGTLDDEVIPAILRFSPMPGGGVNPFPSGMTGVYSANRIAGAYLFTNKHFEVSSGAIIAPPAVAAGPPITTVVAGLNGPIGVAVGSLFIAEKNFHRILKVDLATLTITRVAGTGFATGTGSPPAPLGDGGPATAATLNSPFGVAVDPATGDLYIADKDNHRIRKVGPPDSLTGVRTITTVAGNGTIGSSGDGGSATAATLSFPRGVAVGGGKLDIADSLTQKIRRVDLATGIIGTFAGTGVAGFSGDGGPATSAKLNSPIGVTRDGSGNVYVADEGNNRIRKVDALTDTISTVAGTGVPGSLGDGGAATAAQLNSPSGVAVDPATGDLFIADFSNGKVRKVDFP